jgi:hypothetical protein
MSLTELKHQATVYLPVHEEAETKEELYIFRHHSEEAQQVRLTLRLLSESRSENPSQCMILMQAFHGK